MRRASHALAAYLLVSLVFTWPLARSLGRDVAWDLGDSLLVMWALAWDCEQLLAMLGGDLSRLANLFDANVFHPAPLSLAYSEHFLAQALQILPIYAATDNPILCYNLLFLSTFVLSGLGAYLFVRELTGSAPAAFVAGLAFAFTPYRVAAASHLQVLSSQWMPFALYGLLRYFESRRLRPLAGAAAALVALNLSCGYYLLYFSPFAGAYVLHEMSRRRLWRDARTRLQLAAAAFAVAIATLPFLLPYLALKGEMPMTRPLPEVVRYSADVYSYATASPALPVASRLAQAYAKPEGALFLGLVPFGLAVLGTLAWRRRGDERPAGERRWAILEWWSNRGRDQGGAPPSARWRWRAELALIAIAAGHVTAAFYTLAWRRVRVGLWPIELRMSDVNQLLLRALAALALLLLLSARVRRHTVAFFWSRGFFVAALLAAVWLSFGPSPRTLGRPVDFFGIYQLLYDYVPGFDGVRVPARFAMIAALMLAVLAGFGADVLARSRHRRVLLGVLSIVLIAESLPVPFVVNGAAPPREWNAPEERVYRPGRAPAVYRDLARISAPDSTVLAELPLGDPEFDRRAMFYSTVHWSRLLNGYSGFAPRHYGSLATALSDVATRPDIAWTALRGHGATHVIVHEWAYRDDRGIRTTEALLALGAVELFRDSGDVLLRLE